MSRTWRKGAMWPSKSRENNPQARSWRVWGTAGRVARLEQGREETVQRGKLRAPVRTLE